MNTRRLLTAALVLAAGIALWLVLRREPATPSGAGQPAMETNASPPPTVQSSAKHPQATHDELEARLEAHYARTPDPAYTRRFSEMEKVDPNFEWKQPIDFYGKVLDEHEQPVANARVRFVWNDLSPTGTSEAETATDSSGLFSLRDKRGKGLSVYVSKEDYYSAGNARIANFE